MQVVASNQTTHIHVILTNWPFDYEHNIGRTVNCCGKPKLGSVPILNYKPNPSRRFIFTLVKLVYNTDYSQLIPLSLFHRINCFNQLASWADENWGPKWDVDRSRLMRVHSAANSPEVVLAWNRWCQYEKEASKKHSRIGIMFPVGAPPLKLIGTFLVNIGRAEEGSYFALILVL